MIYGHLFATLLSYIIGNYYLNRIIELPASYQLKNILPFLLAAVLMLFSNWPIYVYVTNEYLFLLLSIFVSTSIYIISLRLLRVEELTNGINWVKQFIAKKNL